LIESAGIISKSEILKNLKIAEEVEEIKHYLAYLTDQVNLKN